MARANGASAAGLAHPDSLSPIYYLFHIENPVGVLISLFKIPLQFTAECLVRLKILGILSS